MSGGVDSSVAAYLMGQLGWDCLGATMTLYRNEDIGISRSRTCCSLEDVEDARSVAHKLNMPYYVFNFSDEIQEYTLEKDYAGYELLLASDMVKYGGKKRYTKKEKVITGGKAVFKIGPFSARYYLVK